MSSKRSSLECERSALKIEKMLGNGSSANAYLARRGGTQGRDDDSSSRHVVLKVLTKTSNEPEDDLSLLKKEVDAMTALECHPNIVSFYGFFWVDEGIDDESIRLPRWAMQLEYCNGGDLHDRVSLKRFEENEAIHVIQGILCGLYHIHKHGYVHRDIKPENVLLCLDGSAKIADFGLCCHTSDEHEMKRRCGSAGYIAPEMILGQAYDQKVDCFSLGILLYFIVSGKMAFNGPDATSTLKKTVKSPLNLRKSMRVECLSQSCKDFLEDLATKDPFCRPSSKEALQSSWFSEAGLVFHTSETSERSETSENILDLFEPCKPEKDIDDAASDVSTAYRMSLESRETDVSTSYRNSFESRERKSFEDSGTTTNQEDQLVLQGDLILEMPFEPQRPEGVPVNKSVPACMRTRRLLRPLSKMRS